MQRYFNSKPTSVKAVLRRRGSVAVSMVPGAALMRGGGFKHISEILARYKFPYVRK